MSDIKAVQLTEDEVQAVIQYHAKQIVNSGPEYSDYIERMKYLDKRLQDFKEKSTEWNK